MVEGDSATDHPQGVRLAFEATPMHALPLRCPDHALYHPVLLRTVQHDELLLQAVAAHQAGVVATGEYQIAVRAQFERLSHTAQCAVAGNTHLLQAGGRGAGLSGP